jgi:hypothetical protein
MANLAKTVQPLTRHNLAHSNGIIGSHLSQADRTGWARRRQLQRQNRERWLARLIHLGAIGWLVMGMLLPLVMYRYSITQAAPANSNWQRHSAARKPGSTAISAGILAASPTLKTPLPTATASPSPTATPTATALPAHLLQATAWQATLDQAAIYSHATQTQAAGQYAATQTALPPVLTANALDRAATSTAAAR